MTSTADFHNPFDHEEDLPQRMYDYSASHVTSEAPYDLFALEQDLASAKRAGAPTNAHVSIVESDPNDPNPTTMFHVSWNDLDLKAERKCRFKQMQAELDVRYGTKDKRWI